MKSNSRYKRQEQLKSFGANNQHKLLKSRVLVVGLGGLGIPVVQYLNAMGVGTLGLVDKDTVELHNLQRQVIYTEAAVGKSKLEVACDFLRSQNSGTNLLTFDTYLSKQNALEIIEHFDVIIDATDNFPTRYLINDACVILKKPFVYGALHDFEGQVSVFNFKGGPTYRDLFPKMPSTNEVKNCDENGVLGVLPGIIGTFQALEAIKLITGVGECLSGELLLYDGLSQSSRKIRFKGKPENKSIQELSASYDSADCIMDDGIDVEVLQNQISKGRVQLIDVRSPEEYAAYHIKDTVNIPLVKLSESLDKIDFIRPVYLICQTGFRSAKALAVLRQDYPDAVLKNVVGGMNKMKHLCQ